ncbi:TonB family protein [Prevotella sp. ne3005]|uniref:TonB family protein n=1 Tax=Prevotella sp. ne3005 TaxID=1761887 RepID=UPI000B881DC9|nr:TonB family protein [Prevotella sp. ne3005]
MMDFLIYDAKVAVLIAVFYMFYRLMLARETFHRVNRLVLLLTAVASFVLPLCVITMHETVTMEAVPVMTVDNLTVDDVAPMPEPAVETPWWQILLPVLFMIGMVVTIGHTLMSMFRILMLIKRSEKHPQSDGTTICVSGNADVPPFSWMHYIVMNQSDYAERNAAILAHERGHIRLRHSWDLLLVDTLTALQWFNPAMWMLRSDLRAIHEYEADGEVLSLGINARQYQYLLITKAASIGGYSLANGISHSTLKNRINMMLHKKSSQTSLLKLLALVPIVGLALAVNAEKVQDVVYTNTVAPSAEELVNEEILQAEPQPAEVVDEAKNKPITFQVVFSPEDSPIAGVPVLMVETGKPVKSAETDKDGKFVLDNPVVGSLVTFTVVNYSKGIRITKDMVAKGDVVKVAFEANRSGKKEPEGTPDSNKAYDVVDEMPQFPGGPSALFEFISKNIQYPKEAEDANLQGRVIVSFVVEKDGSVSNAKVVRPIDPLLDAEALRVVNSMPKWIPGKQNGEAFRVKYTIPVTFRVEGGIKGADDPLVQKTTAYLAGYYAAKNGLPPTPKTLILVDGKEVSYDELEKIKGESIDHMDVLKDKSAIEKYGEKAKDGVILITTKKNTKQ